MFQLKDGNYRAIICASIEQYRGQCNYILVPTTYNSSNKPTTDSLKDKEILGRQIGSGYDKQTTREMQPGIDRIWDFTGGNCNFFFGVTKLVVTHKDFINFKDRFEKIGTLRIIESFKKTGSFGYEENFDRIETIFLDLESYIGMFKQKKYPVTTLCEV